MGRLFGSHVTRVNVYEAATGRRVMQSPADGHNYCRFSSDGHWLLTNSDGGRAYAVPSWRPGPRFGPGTPWDLSPDGRLVVVGETDGIYRLVELATGRELARLEDPDQIAGPAVFTPDGTHFGGRRRRRPACLGSMRASGRSSSSQTGDRLGRAAVPAMAPYRMTDQLVIRVVGSDLVDPVRMAEYQCGKTAFDLYVNPFDGEAYLRHATFLLVVGRLEAGRAHLKAALAFHPDLPASRPQDVQTALRTKSYRTKLLPTAAVGISTAGTPGGSSDDTDRLRGRRPRGRLGRVRADLTRRSVAGGRP